MPSAFIQSYEKAASLISYVAHHIRKYKVREPRTNWFMFLLPVSGASNVLSSTSPLVSLLVLAWHSLPGVGRQAPPLQRK